MKRTAARQQDRVRDFFENVGNRTTKDEYASVFDVSTYATRTRKKSVERALSRFKIELSGLILDVGCGPAALLTEAPQPKIYIGVDISASTLRKTRARIVASGETTLPPFTLVRADAEHLPVASGTTDVVFALAVIGYMENDAKAIAELVRATRPGGVVIFTFTHKYGFFNVIRKVLWPLKWALGRFSPALSRRRAFTSSFRNNAYSRWTMERMLGGGRVLDMTYAGYSPVAFNIKLPRAYFRIVDAFQRLLERRPLLGFLGSSVVVVYQKDLVEP